MRKKVNEKMHLHTEVEAFASRLEQVLAARGLTQKNVADLTGINQGTISRYLGRKTKPREIHRKALVEALPELSGPSADVQLESVATFDRRYLLHVSDSSVLTILESLVAEFRADPENASEPTVKNAGPVFAGIQYKNGDKIPSGPVDCYLTAQFVGAVYYTIRKRDPGCLLVRGSSNARRLSIEEYFKVINPMVVDAMVRHALKLTYGQQMADEVCAAFRLTFNNPPTE